MRVGVLLPTRGLETQDGGPPDPGLLLAMAELAESVGFDSAWVGDSITSKPRLDPLTTLAAIAARTSRLRLGTAVLLPSLRHPVPLAHVIGSVDYLSRGRLVLGMGVGGAFTEEMRREWAAAGVPPGERGARLEETIQIFRGLWTGREFAHEGRHFHFDPVTVRPLPHNGSAPLLTACHSHTGSERQLRRAARLGDGFISITASPEEFAAIRDAVWDYAREEGRDPAELQTVFYMTVALDADAGRASEEANAFLMRYYGVNHWGDRWGPFGRPEAVAGRMSQYARAGAETVVVRFASFRYLEQLETFTREVLPLLEGSAKPPEIDGRHP